MHGTRDEIECGCGTAGDIYDRIGRICGTGDDVHHCAVSGEKCNAAIQSHTGNITGVSIGTGSTAEHSTIGRHSSTGEDILEVSHGIELNETAEHGAAGRNKPIFQEVFQITVTVEGVSHSVKRGSGHCCRNNSCRTTVRNKSIKVCITIGERLSGINPVDPDIGVTAGSLDLFVITGIIDLLHRSVCGKASYTVHRNIIQNTGTGTNCRFDLTAICAEIKVSHIIVIHHSAGTDSCCIGVFDRMITCRRHCGIEILFTPESGMFTTQINGIIRCPAQHIHRSAGKRHVHGRTAGDIDLCSGTDQIGSIQSAAVVYFHRTCADLGLTDSTDDRADPVGCIGMITADLKFAILHDINITECTAGNIQSGICFCCGNGGSITA